MASALAPSRESRVLGRDPRDSCRFWSPHVEKVCTVTQIRLGEEGGGGGGYHWGGGRRTENRDHIYLDRAAEVAVHAQAQTAQNLMAEDIYQVSVECHATDA